MKKNKQERWEKDFNKKFRHHYECELENDSATDVVCNCEMIDIKQFISDLLSQTRKEAIKEGKKIEREKFNKYGRKYNKNPERMLKSKHRYHKRIGKKFKNCDLCKEV